MEAESRSPEMTPAEPTPPSLRPTQGFGDAECARAIAFSILLAAGLLLAVYGAAWASRSPSVGARSTVWIGLAVSLVATWYLIAKFLVPLNRLKQSVDQTLSSRNRWELDVERLGDLRWLAELWNAAGAVHEEECQELSQKIQDLEAAARMTAVQSRRAQAIVDSLGDAILVMDDGGHITYASRACETLLGQKPEELAGKPADECVRHDALREFLAEARRAGADQGPRPIEIEVEQGGETRRLRVISRGLRIEKAGAGYCIVCRDVTHQRTTEEMRNRLIDNVSSELVQPLADIRARSDRLLKSAGDQPSSVREAAEAIHANVKMVSNLINDLRRLTEIETGGMLARRRPVQMETLLRETTELVRLQAATKQLDWRVNAPSLLPPVNGDPDMIKVILLNLLTNAVKFTPEGGRVEVEAKAQDGRVLVRLRDTGVGISEEDLPRIFDKFYRTEQARAMGAPGAGLGLTLAREMTLLNDGELRVTSQLGEGTEVTLTLPIAEGLQIAGRRRLMLSDVSAGEPAKESNDGDS